MGRGERRYLLGLVALTMFAVLVAASGSTAATPVTKKLPGVKLVGRHLGPFNLDNDPKRCLAALFVMFPNVQGAITYKVHVDYVGSRGSQDVDGIGPPFRDDVWKPYIPPIHPYLKVDPGHHWFKIGEYSVGSGCDDADMGIADVKRDFKVGAATVTVDPAKYKPPPPETPKKPCPTAPDSVWTHLPKGSIGVLVEIVGPLEKHGSKYRATGVWIQHKGGMPQQATVYQPILAGDMILTDKNSNVAVEMVTGGRLGINHDRFVRIGKEGEPAQGLPNPTATFPELTLKTQQGTAKLERLWTKMQKRKHPLEIQAAGGVMGCKG